MYIHTYIQIYIHVRDAFIVALNPGLGFCVPKIPVMVLKFLTKIGRAKLTIFWRLGNFF